MSAKPWHRGLVLSELHLRWKLVPGPHPGASSEASPTVNTPGFFQLVCRLSLILGATKTRADLVSTLISGIVRTRVMVAGLILAFLAQTPEKETFHYYPWLNSSTMGPSGQDPEMSLAGSL